MTDPDLGLYISPLSQDDNLVRLKIMEYKRTKQAEILSRLIVYDSFLRFVRSCLSAAENLTYNYIHRETSLDEQSHIHYAVNININEF